MRGVKRRRETTIVDGEFYSGSYRKKTSTIEYRRVQ